VSSICTLFFSIHAGRLKKLPEVPLSPEPTNDLSEVFGFGRKKSTGSCIKVLLIMLIFVQLGNGHGVVFY
jgi:hypothetical protein